MLLDQLSVQLVFFCAIERPIASGQVNFKEKSIIISAIIMTKVCMHDCCLCAQFSIFTCSITLKCHAKFCIWEKAHKLRQFRLKKCNYLATSRFFQYGVNKSPTLFRTKPAGHRLRAELRPYALCDRPKKGVSS